MIPAASPNLTLCGSGIADAGPGGFLQSVGGAFVGPVFVTNHGGGSYTVDQSILGNPCGATATDGTLFTIHVLGRGTRRTGFDHGDRGGSARSATTPSSRSARARRS